MHEDRDAACGPAMDRPAGVGHVRKLTVAVGLLLLSAGLFLAACARPTEEQRLAKFRGSLKYKTYRLASDKFTRFAVTEYKKSAAHPVDDMFVHSTLGVVWILSEKGQYALAEADIVDGIETNDPKIVSLGLRSIALFKMKCPALSRLQYEELKTALAARRHVDPADMEAQHKVFLLILIAASLSLGDADLARFSADSLGAVSQLDYLPPLVGAVAEAGAGHPFKAAAQLRELNKSERFSEHKRAILGEVADILAGSTDREKLGEEITRRVVSQLVRRVLEDVFTVEDQRALLEKLKAFPGVTASSTNAPPAPAGSPETAVPTP